MNPNELLCVVFPPNYTYLPTYDFPVKQNGDSAVIPDMFGYVFPTVEDLAAAGGTTQVQVIIQDDSDFEVRRLAYHFTAAEAAITNATAPCPNWTLQLTDTGAGRSLFNNPVPIDTVATGPGMSPRDLPWPKILRRNSTIQATLTNFDAAQATGRLYLVMFGRKLFS